LILIKSYDSDLWIFTLVICHWNVLDIDFFNSYDIDISLKHCSIYFLVYNKYILNHKKWKHFFKNRKLLYWCRERNKFVCYKSIINLYVLTSSQFINITYMTHANARARCLVFTNIRNRICKNHLIKHNNT
jgi:hypothetical protein